MLKGEAKTAYMREYMRRKRAGLKPATATPRAHQEAPSQELAEARREIEALRRQQATKAAPASSHELAVALGEIALLRQQVRVLKAELAAKPKPAKPERKPLDPDSEAARQIKGLKMRVSTLTRQLRSKDHREIMALAADAPFTLRGSSRRL